MATIAATLLKTQKRALRQKMAVVLRAIPSASLDEQSRAVTTHLLSSALFTQSKNIALFLSMPSGEVQTDALAKAILQNGKNLFVPRIIPVNETESAVNTNTMQMLRVPTLAALEEIKPRGKWGLREPDPQGAEVAQLDVLDLMLVPGVAFDRSGNPKRLGHGKGYYDTYLSSIASPNMPKLVALALNEQLLDENAVPVGSQDWVLDAVLTSEGFYPHEPDTTGESFDFTDILAVATVATLL